MASVFLSYDRDDTDKARPIALALEKAGHSVWWDQQIRGGAQYSKEIEEALDEADAVVVLWSRSSVESAWVRDEAAEARDCGKLVPVAIDSTKPPMGFRQFQTIELFPGTGRARAKHTAEVVAAVERLRSTYPDRSGDATVSRAFSVAAHRRHLPRSLLLLLIAAAAVATFFAVWQLSSRARRVPIIAVTAADPSPNTRVLARNLLVRLGNAQAGKAAAIQLVDENGRKTPDFIVEVSTQDTGSHSSANLVLVRGRDRQLLSSQDLAPSDDEVPDIETSVAIAANAALGCTADALASRPSLHLALLKAYLKACSQFSALYGMEDVSILLPQLDEIVRREPRFLPARKLLLLGSASMLPLPTDSPKPRRQSLEEQAAAVRQFDPASPELRIAESQLLPRREFAARLDLLDDGLKATPDDLYLLAARAEQLMVVGRNNEAVVDAERAARLYPLAPLARSEYVRTLAFSGRLSRALEELKDFNPLRSLAMNLTDSRFRVNMRYGDPRTALAILRTYGTNKAHEAFLLARINPTQSNVEQAVATARSLATQHRFYASLTEVLEAFGRDDETFDTLMRLPSETADESVLQTLFRPSLQHLRRNPRFLRVAKRFGLVEYWQKSGKWPDFCSDPGLPYDCKKEAAKLAA
jgi:hypothetical protein